MGIRIERDSLGEIEVPESALYGAQTARARANFQISGYRFPREFLRALGAIKAAAAQANAELGALDPALADAIVAAAREVEQGRHDEHFPLDVFQTGSGTSTNMNANEVIATLASRSAGVRVHPNDHVNLGQSSNDVIPTAILVSSAVAIAERLLPALDELGAHIGLRAAEFADTVKTGRTHLMDAVPMTLGQELAAWDAQIGAAMQRLAQRDLLQLPLGGTAIGTGINASPEFGARAIAKLAEATGLPFTAMENRFAGIAGQDAALHASAQLRGVAVVLMKIADDLRWMNSSGLAEIALPALQPGSSIMPGKVNPVIPEAVRMACAHVIGNDAGIAVAAQGGNFQLNTMLPLIGWKLLDSIAVLANAASALTHKAIAGFAVNADRLSERAARNPILATALAPVIGYDAAAKIAQEAERTGRSVYEVARERTSIEEDKLRELLDPRSMTG